MMRGQMRDKRRQDICVFVREREGERKEEGEGERTKNRFYYSCRMKLLYNNVLNLGLHSTLMIQH